MTEIPERAIVVIHHRDEKRPCHRRFTIAGVLGTDNKLRLGVAVANPLDKAFVKKKGSVKALGRARSSHPFIEVEFHSAEGKTPSEIYKELHASVSFYAASLASMDERLFVHNVGKMYGKRLEHCEEHVHHNRLLLEDA
jgi:hypothetical protein